MNSCLSEPSAIYSTSLFQLNLFCSEKTIDRIELALASQTLSQSSKPVLLKREPLAQKWLETMEKWEKDPATIWQLPLAHRGTIFQRKVYQYIQKIPIGQTQSYSDITNQLNSGPRAVANACARNPFLIIVPCHRVTGKNDLGGFNHQKTGGMIEIKKWMLTHEKCNHDSQ